MFKTQQIFLINDKFFAERDGVACYVKVRENFADKVTDGTKCKLVLMSGVEAGSFYYEIKAVL